MNRFTRISCYVTFGLLTGCSSLTPTSSYNSNTVNIPGVYDTASMSSEQLHSAIEVAYLDGQLNAEQVKRARMRLAKTKPASM